MRAVGSHCLFILFSVLCTYLLHFFLPLAYIDPILSEWSFFKNMCPGEKDLVSFPVREGICSRYMFLENPYNRSLYKSFHSRKSFSWGSGTVTKYQVVGYFSAYTHGIIFLIEALLIRLAKLSSIRSVAKILIEALGLQSKPAIRACWVDMLLWPTSPLHFGSS